MSRLRLLLGAAHGCGYLPDRPARNAFIDPAAPLDASRYGALLAAGFRRSGDYVYRPWCSMCRSCMPARVLVRQFRPSRAQRRCLAANADLECTVGHRLDDAHFELYAKYLQQRHPGGGMDPDDCAAFREFLGCRWMQTQVWEFRGSRELLAVAVVDPVPEGFSAVYTFYQPRERRRGLGTYALLQQILAARELGLDYVYLGYWVAGSQTMDYKRHFRPLQILRPAGWSALA